MIKSSDYFSPFPSIYSQTYPFLRLIFYIKLRFLYQSLTSDLFITQLPPFGFFLSQVPGYPLAASGLFSSAASSAFWSLSNLEAFFSLCFPKAEPYGLFYAFVSLRTSPVSSVFLFLGSELFLRVKSFCLLLLFSRSAHPSHGFINLLYVVDWKIDICSSDMGPRPSLMFGAAISKTPTFKYLIIVLLRCQKLLNTFPFVSWPSWHPTSVN